MRCLAVPWSACCGLFLAAAAVTAQQPPPVVSLDGRAALRIGSVDGPPETTFAAVAGAVRLEDGRVAVADRGGKVIRFFDASGTHAHSVGREGRGPGEFEDLTWLGPCPDGGLLAVDPVLNRVAHMSAHDGRLVRHVALPERFGYNRVLSCRAAGELVALFDHIGPAGSPGRVAHMAAAVVRVTPERAVGDTLVRLPGTEYYFATAVPGFAPVPLGVKALAAAGGGFVYAAQNDAEEIHVIELATGRRTSFDHGLPRPRLTVAARRAAVDEFIASQPQERTRQLLARVLQEAPSAAAHPRIMDLKADRSGRLWLRLPSSEPGSSVVWQVRRPDGRHIVSVRMPANVEPLDIGESYIVAVERDALGVPSILLYSDLPWIASDGRRDDRRQRAEARLTSSH